MDSKALADTLTQILAPALPHLVGRGVGDHPPDMDRVRALWHRLRQRVEEKPAAHEAVEDLAWAPEDPDAQAALRRQLWKLLEGDAVLAAEMASFVESAGKIQGAEAVALGGAVVAGPGAVVVGAGGIAIGKVGWGELSAGPLRAGSRN